MWQVLLLSFLVIHFQSLHHIRKTLVLCQWTKHFSQKVWSYLENVIFLLDFVYQVNWFFLQRNIPEKQCAAVCMQAHMHTHTHTHTHTSDFHSTNRRETEKSLLFHFHLLCINLLSSKSEAASPLFREIIHTENAFVPTTVCTSLVSSSLQKFSETTVGFCCCFFCFFVC